MLIEVKLREGYLCPNYTKSLQSIERLCGHDTTIKMQIFEAEAAGF